MARRSMLMLLTFAVRGSHALRVWRAMHDEGFDVGVAFYSGTNGAYEEDGLEDFRKRGRVLDLTSVAPRRYEEEVRRYIDDQGVGLLVQVGFEPLYPVLPSLRVDYPSLRMLDLLYNDVGHTISHFLFERVFDGTVVESRAMERFVFGGSELAEATVHVVESGIDIDSFVVRPADEPARPLTIGYVGRLSAEKNPLGFVTIAEALAAEDADLQFRVFGGGPMRDAVDKAVSDSRAGDRLRFGGFTADVQEALSQVDVLVVPSRFDGRPNVIMEANASGIPVVAAPVGGIPEMIEDGVNGHLCAVGDVRRMQELVRGWRQRPESLRAMSRSARALAESRFTRERMVRAYADTFGAYLG